MTEVEKAYQNFLKVLEKHNPDPQKDLLEKAFRFAEHAHRDQRRLSGEPYVIHPLLVATHLAKLNMDSRAIAAGFLHDVLEDTSVDFEQLKNEFGENIAQLVDGVSKLKSIRFEEKNQYIENLRKMFVATAKDIRVILIRLCDRLHNVQTLEYMPLKEQKRIALETLEIYAPIANRLQIGSLRGELEDWAFKFLQPEDYRWLYNVTRKNFEKKHKALQETVDQLKKTLTEEKIEYIDVQYRIKHIYSLYKKLQRYDNDLSRIYDIIAIRIILPNVSDCYAAMGIAHKEYKPIKGRIKDYIARQKPNGYRSLHTTVMLKNGEIIEMQFRTKEMHAQAEYGIAAHWQYKESVGYTKREMQISWVNELVEILQEISDMKDLEHLKLDLFNHRIFALTPKGDVIDLPEEATPVDFAYHIHTDIGNTAIRAKINGRSKPLSTKLQNGDIVEIMINKNKKAPDLEWLDFVKTSLAKSKIKYFNRKKLSRWEQQLAQTDKHQKKNDRINLTR